MAVSIRTGSVFAHPAKVKDPAGTARRLAPHLDMNPSEIERKLKKDLSFVWLARQVPLKDARAVQQLRRGLSHGHGR